MREAALVVRACRKVRLSDTVVLRRLAVYDISSAYRARPVVILVGCRGQGKEWRWARLRDSRFDSASAFGFARLMPVWHGCGEYSMIWRGEELFWVPCACGVDGSVACLLRCGGAW